jgi:hypothetical protein
MATWRHNINNNNKDMVLYYTILYILNTLLLKAKENS